MLRSNACRCSLTPASLVLLVIGATIGAGSLSAADYFLTIGGGYSKTGNQASLEANVVFFQQLLAEKHREPRRHDIFFADGADPAADLQISAGKPGHGDSPATDLLAALHRRRGAAHVDYRNHRVADIAGPLEPKLIRGALESLAEKARHGDRLIIYVTAHGSAGPKDDPFNTTIDCWNQGKISAREFTNWLNKMPPDVPVVMVMAQCYCGGFGHSIFAELDEKQGLSPRLRAGFFAQQHDLPAAGCRPDIEHDEEYSSYFWGALAGRSRNGVAIEGCDRDGNGVISFAEAHAHAVVAGETIDIPLTTSEVLLRTYSRLTVEAAPPAESDSGPAAAVVDPTQPEAEGKPMLHTLTGTLETVIESGRPISRSIVIQLTKTLGFALQDDVTTVRAALDAGRRGSRPQGRGRGSRQSSRRRDLLKEVAEKWPELGSERTWEESPLLRVENQEPLLLELKQLAGWKAYSERREQTEAADTAADQREIRTAKIRRLLNTLESIVLEKNLPYLATARVVEHYRQLVSLEESSLNAGAVHK